MKPNHGRYPHIIEITPTRSFENEHGTSIVEARSLATGDIHTYKIPADARDIQKWMKGDAGPIQSALPNLTTDQREFLISGCTPEEWESILWETDEDTPSRGFIEGDENASSVDA